MFGKTVKLNWVVVSCLLVLGLASCSKTKQQQLRDDEIADRSKYLKENSDLGFVRSSTGLYYAVIEDGEGEDADPGDKCYVWYTCSYLDGTVYRSNMVNGKFEPAGVTLYGFGQGDPYLNSQGVHEALTRMKKSGKLRIVVPSSLTLGSSMPPYNSMVYDLELMDIKRANE